MAYLVRYSAHIKEDIERGWSSWSFGADGLCGPLERLVEYLEEIIESGENALDVSGFTLPLYRFEIEDDEQFVRLYAERSYVGKLGQLRPGYWVLVDETNGRGLACCDPVFDTEEEARQWIASLPACGPDMSTGTFVETSAIIRVCDSQTQDGYGWHRLEVEV